MGKRRRLLREEYDPEWRNQFFSSLPKNPTPDEIKEWEWAQEEKKRTKIVNHDWLFKKWLKSKKH